MLHPKYEIIWPLYLLHKATFRGFNLTILEEHDLNQYIDNIISIKKYTTCEPLSPHIIILLLRLYLYLIHHQRTHPVFIMAKPR